MATIAQIMQKTRVRLRQPRSQAPTTREVLEAVTTHVQTLYNRLNNTGHSWTTAETEISVVPGVRDYLLQAQSNFGKPLYIVNYANNNGAYIERLIDIFEVQDLPFNFGLPENTPIWTWDGTQATAARIAFFRSNDQTYIRFKPIPQLSATYKIGYSIGDFVDGANLSDSPVLSNHHDLVELYAARTLLPFAEWWDSEAQNQGRRKELSSTIQADIQLLDNVFEKYILSLHGATMSYRWSSADDVDGY